MRLLDLETMGDLEAFCRERSIGVRLWYYHGTWRASLVKDACDIVPGRGTDWFGALKSAVIAWEAKYHEAS